MSIMLRVYEVVIALIALLAPVAEEIERRDVKLGRQMKDAMASVALNTAEGAGNIGGHKRQRYQSARGSAWEVKACLDVAQAMRYIGPVDPAALDKLDHVIAVMTKLTHRR
ncbi:MAG: four helix bundle protein [Polyangiaceae bacterium]|nr:four helix bundle protein [Polyangiaceae bacterium]